MAATEGSTEKGELDVNLNRVADFDRKYRVATSDGDNIRGRSARWLRRKLRKITCRRVLLSNFPIINSLREYQPLRDLPGDLTSGITVGIMHIPQGMAFAVLANLQPIVGLYVAFVSTLVYFFLGGSRQASFGLIAVVCLMIAAVLDNEVAPPAEPDVTLANVSANGTEEARAAVMAAYEDQKLKVAGAVSFVAGIFLMGLGKLGMGFVTTFMPDPLIKGFTTGAAVYVAISQTSPVLGIKVPRHNGPLRAVYSIVEICKHLPDVNWMPTVISLVSMVIMYVVKVHVNQRYKKRLKIPIPIELLVMIVSLLVSKYCDLHEEYDLRIVGDIPTGLPAPSLPDLSLARNSVTQAFAIAIVLFSQAVALAKTFAAKHGYQVDPDQEMFAYGACTVASSLFSGVAASASMARSLVQDGAGGKSQLASLLGCLVVLLVILLLGPLFHDMPFCILSSVIIVNLRGMFRQLLLLKTYWRQSKTDLVLFLGTFLAVIFVDIDLGLAIGIGIAVLSVVVRTQRADLTELGRVEDLDAYKPFVPYPKSSRVPNTIILQFSSPIYFANCESFLNRLIKMLNIHKHKNSSKRDASKDIPMSKTVESNGYDNLGFTNEEIAEQNGESIEGKKKDEQCVMLDLSGASFIDTMGAAALQTAIKKLSAAGVTLFVIGLPDTALDVLRATDEWNKFSNNFLLRLPDAVRDITTVVVHL